LRTEAARGLWLGVHLSPRFAARRAVGILGPAREQTVVVFPIIFRFEEREIATLRGRQGRKVSPEPAVQNI
jgi:nitroimidazol reductase NimA-like FMN-containing flavoprotein (pyridoxamine 5'-phosphate oxidase superfamily)